MTVVPLNAKGVYTDFRVLLRDVEINHPEVKKGIVIFFDEKECMMTGCVCQSRDLAYAGAYLSKLAVEDE